MEHLINYLKEVIPVSPQAENFITLISKKINCVKGEILLREGQSVNKMYFVIDGCLRSYCTDKNGKEHTLQFAIKNWWISDYSAITTKRPSQLNIECLKDGQLIEINAQDMEKLRTIYPEFADVQRKNTEAHLVSLQERILSQLQLSGTERYNIFLKKHPDMEQSIRNYHIASYLGITQESLSRIRAEKARK